MNDSARALVRTPRLILRQFCPGDAPVIYRMSQEESLRAWLPNQVYESEEQAASVIGLLISQYADPGDPSLGPYVLGVELANASGLIGHVGLSPVAEGVEIGFAIAQMHQRKGFATEAVTAFAEWGRLKFSLPSIIGIASSANAASCRVLSAAGFRLRQEGMRLLHGRTQSVRTFQHAHPCR